MSWKTTTIKTQNNKNMCWQLTHHLIHKSHFKKVFASFIVTILICVMKLQPMILFELID